MAKKLEFKDNFLIGVISDTHGRIPSGITTVFRKVDLIIHAGDIGDETVLNTLSKIAPVIAVRGNMDFGHWARLLPETELIQMGPMVLKVVHIADRLSPASEGTGFKVVISGHTHRPEVYEKNGITFVNPGSASYPKFGSPGSAAMIRISNNNLRVKLIQLKD